MNRSTKTDQQFFQQVHVPVSEEENEQLAQSFCKIPNISLEEEWHRRLILEKWQPPPPCAPIPQLARIISVRPVDHPTSAPILTILPSDSCRISKHADIKELLSFIYMDESTGNWTSTTIEENGTPLPSETGILHCASHGIATAAPASASKSFTGGSSNLVMHFVPRPEIRRAAERAEARYRRWRHGLLPAGRRRLPRRRPNLVFVMVDSLSQAQVGCVRGGAGGGG
jgi:hypothetical protein